MKANQILQKAQDAMKSRATERDRDEERSMLPCVKAFNAITGHRLTEEQGWLFMVILKLSRSQGGCQDVIDDYIDGAAYFALAGESVLNKNKPTIGEGYEY
jgi:hypothetical protein